MKASLTTGNTEVIYSSYDQVSDSGDTVASGREKDEDKDKRVRSGRVGGLSLEA